MKISEDPPDLQGMRHAMIEPPLSPDEPARLQALQRLVILDTPLSDRFERITRVAQKALETPIAAISLLDADRQWFKSIQGSSLAQTARAVSFCTHTILREDVMVVPDARIDPRFEGNPLVCEDPHIVFYAGCPVRATDGSRIGSLCVLDRKPRSPSFEDIEILRDLAAVTERELFSAMQAGAQQELITQLDQLSRQARIDPLTRVWNRESIFEILDLALARARRARQGVAIIMADVDHFKQINDTLGHAAGDEVLRQATRRSLAAIREEDAIGRYGGEEFLIVLGPCDGLESAIKIAERIRSRLSSGPIKTEYGSVTVTSSLGVAYAESARGLDRDVLVRMADESLYRAKNQGRNAVCSSLVPAGDCASIAA
ncbi:MAG TPA: sensor domain-containing diguanylate cyclase [Phycisphaerales bacterium]|nr:sensor domain-containing diguanylate cyclase [Phycisphaerales bacterium]